MTAPGATPAPSGQPAATPPAGPVGTAGEPAAAPTKLLVHVEALREAHRRLTGPATDQLVELHRRIGRIDISSPGFGVIGIGANKSHTASQAQLLDQVIALNDRLAAIATALKIAADAWQDTDSDGMANRDTHG
ncbi:hypothetical protein [Catellatospora tritici]|uniref:hypothetical protein n=1 Tax=Catellatospora tritici TaxID=2851566 RepID=UPI001C2DD441|nr:hypothetical protein [Catellatospora tritici]MBV1853554.1 hypothetical protein [Catellatospora tritici]